MKTILHIDDDTAMLEIVQAVLSEKGYRVFSAATVESATRYLQEAALDLVLLDVNMPEKHGFTVYREIASGRQVPVLFLTACPKSFDGESPEFVSLWDNLFTLGMTDILYKPFNLQTLYDKVEGLIGEGEPVAHERMH
jgi:DNA-binding response OmpR family regulator